MRESHTLKLKKSHELGNANQAETPAISKTSPYKLSADYIKEHVDAPRLFILEVMRDIYDEKDDCDIHIVTFGSKTLALIPELNAKISKQDGVMNSITETKEHLLSVIYKKQEKSLLSFMKSDKKELNDLELLRKEFKLFGTKSSLQVALLREFIDDEYERILKSISSVKEKISYIVQILELINSEVEKETGQTSSTIDGKIISMKQSLMVVANLTTIFNTKKTQYISVISTISDINSILLPSIIQEIENRNLNALSTTIVEFTDKLKWSA